MPSRVVPGPSAPRRRGIPAKRCPPRQQHHKSLGMGAHRCGVRLGVDEQAELAASPSRDHAAHAAVQPHETAVDSQSSAQLRHGVGVVRRKVPEQQPKHRGTQLPFQLHDAVSDGRVGGREGGWETGSEEGGKSPPVAL